MSQSQETVCRDADNLCPQLNDREREKEEQKEKEEGGEKEKEKKDRS